MLLTHLTLVTSGMESAATRFYSAFCDTWQRMPADAQISITDYLEQKPGRVFLCYAMDYSQPPEEPLGRSSWFEDRTIFTFLAPFILHAEIEGPIGVIGHELAHCFNKGAGTWAADENEEEVNAREVARGWGFLPPWIDGTIWNPEIEDWRLRHAVDKGHLTEERLILGLSLH